MKKMLALDGGFEAIRMISGAISAIYLQSKGLPLAGIAELKMIQSVAGFVLEFPTGLIADALGRRLCLFVSCLLGALAFGLYFSGTAFGVFALAEVALSLCLTLWSGAYEAFALGEGRITAEADTNRFFHLNASVNAGATALAGVLGGGLAQLYSGLPFVVASLSFLGLAAFVVPERAPRLALKGRGIISGTIASLRLQAGKTAQWVKGDLQARRVLVALAACQFIMQPIIYYWQIWFAGGRALSSALALSFIFVAFQGTLFAAGLLGARLSRQPWTRTWSFQALCWAVFAGSLAATVSLHSQVQQVATFCLAEACFSLSLAALKARLAQECRPELRASAFSAAALLGRAAGLTSLGLVSAALTFPHFSGVGPIFLCSAVAAMALAVYALRLQAKESLRAAYA